MYKGIASFICREGLVGGDNKFYTMSQQHLNKEDLTQLCTKR